MVLASPRTNGVDTLVYWGTEPGSNEDLEDQLDKASIVAAIDEELHGPRRQSMYVEEFEKMLKTVLTDEACLFSSVELNVLRNYSELTREAGYLLIRLCLRKSNKWHRLGNLNYQRELGDGIVDAIQELCRIFPVPLSTGLPEIEQHQDVKHENITNERSVKVEEREIIDLTSDDKDCKPETDSSDPLSSTPSQHQALDKSAHEWSRSFADDETSASLEELLDCLKLEELKTLTKDLKLKPSGSRRDCLVDSILRSSSGQTTLNFQVTDPSSARSRDKDKAGPSSLKTPLSAGWNVLRTQRDRVRDIVIGVLGKCVKVSGDMIDLVRRVHLIYFRRHDLLLLSAIPFSLLVPSILARAKKRTYAYYKHERTRNVIWPSRRDLLEYERALKLQAEVEALEGSNPVSSSHRDRSTVGRSPGPAASRLKTPVTVKRDASTKSPATPRRNSGVKSEIDTKENLVDDDPLVDQSTSSKRRIANARALAGIFESVIWSWWRELVAVKGDGSVRPRGLERFECGHILTRLVCKCSFALGILKQYDRELEVLEALLAQRRWRRGRRGRWYDRRACILSTHFEQTEQTVMRTMSGVRDALIDDDTHLIFRPKLHRRLTRLEKKLKIPEEERHVCQGDQRKPDKVVLYGTRVYRRAGSLILDRTGRNFNKQSDVNQTRLPFSPQTDTSLEKPVVVEEKRTGKTIWKGRNDEEVTVEMFALQHYENQGYKGFHCEGRIVTTLFGILFWDIIFASIPGAFETPFQTAPLDIAEDTFYYSRQALVEDRLTDLKAGKALQLVEDVCAQHEETGTLCVGVRWDLFTSEDLIQIVECLGGEALAVICRLLCEEYDTRTSGVPDLIVWNTKTSDCRFVEVKGPGDSLQENQKTWIDVLSQAGIPVEVCHVFEERGVTKTKGKKVKQEASSRKRKRSDSEPAEPLFLESEDEPEAMEDAVPHTPRSTRVVDLVEVVITSPSPKKRRM
ncbi:hypothetical protein CERSUDRAFT_93772 [Gelatoporia subvermispora B]|uniref:Fanconi-associated nuclease n=1 Tax=Ceriporiopsis subvermispora (strain B) TaxID=914234 RepID=M2RHE2_CERS8|nr:hypothetical protein CERSUDRAFT_93772 [Gelatoporia subvermispora B]